MANNKPLMPKATAVWLVENTTLSFEQIALFCGLHSLEIQAIADGDVAQGIVGKNPVTQGILTDENIKACEANPQKTLEYVAQDVPDVQRRAKGPRYTPVTKRADKPDGIAYLLKYYPEIPDAQIIKLLGTTKNTIESIRNRSNVNITNIKPTDPVQLGLCTRNDLDVLIRRVEEMKERKAAKANKSGKAPRSNDRDLGLDDDAPADAKAGYETPQNDADLDETNAA